MISQLAVVGGSSYPNMSPMIIMNNVLLKPVGLQTSVDRPVLFQIISNLIAALLLNRIATTQCGTFLRNNYFNDDD